MLNGIIYKITCMVDKNCYIGQTYQPIEMRWQSHKTGRGSKPLYDAIQKHGLEMFKFEILHEGITCREELNRLEIALIEAHNAYTDGYNEDWGGQDEFRYSEAWEHSDEICRLYRDDLQSLRQLAKQFETSYGTIKVILKSKGVQRRKKSHGWEHAQEICNLYTQENKSMVEISEKYEISPSTVKKILVAYRIKLKPANRDKNHELWKHQSEICRLYTIEKQSYVRIGKQFGTCKNQIKRILMANDIKLRSYSPRKRASNQQLVLDLKI